LFSSINRLDRHKFVASIYNPLLAIEAV